MESDANSGKLVSELNWIIGQPLGARIGWQTLLSMDVILEHVQASPSQFTISLAPARLSAKFNDKHYHNHTLQTALVLQAAILKRRLFSIKVSPQKFHFMRKACTSAKHIHYLI